MMIKKSRNRKCAQTNESMEHCIEEAHVLSLGGGGSVGFFLCNFSSGERVGFIALALLMSWLILFHFIRLGWGSLLFHMLYQKVSSFHLYMWVKASQIYNIMKF
jgi:hypothetical protein